jgi:uncharacterized delta-60 repeat protein
VLLAANLLDPSFGGGDGVVTTDVGPGAEEATAVAVLPDGKVVVAGTARGTSGNDFVVLRYNSDGALDKGFGGGDGIVTIDFGAGDDSAAAVASLNGGKILLAGTAAGRTTGSDFALARLNADGSLDRSFGGGDGKVTTPVGAGRAGDFGRDIALPGDGDVLVAGQTTSGDGDGDFAMVRYNADGTVDRGFGGGDGIVTTGFGSGSEDAANALALAAGGKIVLAGGTDAPALTSRPTSDDNFAVARYNRDGTLDRTFSGDGKVVTSTSSDDDVAQSAEVLVDEDGDMLVAGQGYLYSYSYSDNPAIVVRYNADGSLDRGFGGGSGIAYVHRLATERADVVAVAGGRFLLSGGNFGLARLNRDGTLDPTFDGDDGVFHAGALSEGDTAAMAVMSDGRAVLVGAVRDSFDSPKSRFAAIRVKNFEAVGDPDDQLFEAAPLVVGATRSGAISGATDVDVYRFSARAGQRVVIDLDRAAGSRLDSILRLFDALGNELVMSDDAPAPGEAAGTTESFLDFFAGTSGTYYVGVSGAPNAHYGPTGGLGDVPGSTGGYVLRMADVPTPADPDDQIREAVSVTPGGAPRTGRIDPDTDVDLYRFTARAGQTLGFDIDLPAGATLGSLLTLFAADGTRLAQSDTFFGEPAPGEPSSDGNESYLQFTFPAAGSFYLGVSGRGNSGYSSVTGAGDAPSSKGAYTLTVTNVVGDTDDQLAEAVRLTPGTRSGAISFDGDVDMYRLQVASGQVIQLDVDSPADGGVDSLLRLFDSTGAAVASSGDDAAPGEEGGRDPYLEYAVDSGGAFYVGVSGQDNEFYDPVTGAGDGTGDKGRYSLTLALRAGGRTDNDDQISEARAVAFGAPVSGELGQSDVDVYAFTVAAGQSVTINVDQSNVDAVLRLFGGSGAMLAQTGESAISFAFDAGGTYYVGVSGEPNFGYSPVTGAGDSASSATGKYTLTVRRFPSDPDDQISEARPVAAGARISAEIDPGVDVDMYRFTAAGGQEFDVTVTAGTNPGLSPFLRLFDGRGQFLAQSDAGALRFRFAAGGTYYAAVSGPDNTSYDPVTGKGDSSGSTGAYSFAVRTVPADPDDQISEATPAALGSTRSGAINPGSDVDMYAVDLVAGRGVAIDIDVPPGGLAGPALRVFDSAGRSLAADTGSKAPGETAEAEAYLEFFPEVSGTYYVGVSGGGNLGYDPTTGRDDLPGGATGGYRMILGEPPPDPDSNDQISEAANVAPGAAASSSIGPATDVDFFEVTVSAGQRLGLDIDLPSGSGLDPLVRLFDAAGKELSRSDDAPAPGEPHSAEAYLEFLFARAGTYYVAVSSDGNADYNPLTGRGDAPGTSAGAYILRVNRLR